MTSIGPNVAGPSGAPLRVLEGGEGAVAVAVAGYLYAGGAWARPPIVGDPRWRTEDDATHSLGELLAGQRREVREQLLAAHAEVIGAIVRTAAAVKASGESPRALIATATRLCLELIGQP
ncbi:MAG: hypothetical protein ACRDLO_06090 [Solirubrobacterales bacterium]